MESPALNYSDAYYRPREDEYPEKRVKIKYLPSRDSSGRVLWKELPAKRRHKYDCETSTTTEDAYSYPLYPPMHSGDDFVYENYPNLPVPYKPCMHHPQQQEFIRYVYPCPEFCIETVPTLPYAGDVQQYQIRKIPRLRRRRYHQYASANDFCEQPKITYPEYAERGVETSKPDVKSVSCGNFRELKETSSQSDEIKRSFRSVECCTDFIEEEVIVSEEKVSGSDSGEVKEPIEVVFAKGTTEEGSVCVVEEPQEEHLNGKRANSNVVFEEVSSEFGEEKTEELQELEEVVDDTDSEKCPVESEETQTSVLSAVAEFFVRYLSCLLKIFPRLSLKQILIRIFFP